MINRAIDHVAGLSLIGALGTLSFLSVAMVGVENFREHIARPLVEGAINRVAGTALQVAISLKYLNS